MADKEGEEKEKEGGGERSVGFAIAPLKLNKHIRMPMNSLQCHSRCVQAHVHSVVPVHVTLHSIYFGSYIGTVALLIFWCSSGCGSRGLGAGDAVHRRGVEPVVVRRARPRRDRRRSARPAGRRRERRRGRRVSPPERARAKQSTVARERPHCGHPGVLAATLRYMVIY